MTEIIKLEPNKPLPQAPLVHPPADAVTEQAQSQPRSTVREHTDSASTSVRGPRDTAVTVVGGGAAEDHYNLSINNWKDDYRKIIKDYSLSQYDYYKENTNDEVILGIVALESKRFGSVSEKLLCNIYEIGQRTSSQNDGVRNGKKIEIKAARRWAGKDNCRWQHLEQEHDYDCALFALLDFGGWKVWGIKKSILFGECKEKNIVTQQGKQGWWCEKNSILPYLTPIYNINQLDDFLDTI